MEGKKPAGARSRQAMAALAGADLNGSAGSAGISEATPHAHKEGFLTKQGHFRKTWKRRWFVLEYPHLRYFKNRGDTEQAGEVDCTGVTLSDTASTKTGRDFCFGIFHKDREPYFLQAESQEEMMEWVAAIRHDDSVGMIDFDQLKVLGEGAYGEVFLVRHRTTGTKLAMKVLSKAAMVEHGAVENTKTEREILLRVRHPFVVQMHYAFQTAEKLFMVMDYVNAGDLYSHMCSKKRFSEKVMKIWIAEIALAVGYLHEVGVVFRDLKPENVLLDERGHAHLTDFGLSKTVESWGDKLMTFCGTPYYLAPELITHGSGGRGRKGYTKDIDWWAVGILSFELLVGDPPFRGQSAQEVYKAIVNKPIASVQASMKRFSRDASGLVVGFLERKVDCRLGYGQADVVNVKKHPFFADLDWDRLLAKEVPVGYVPPKGDDAVEDHYKRTMTKLVDEVAEKPTGLMERVRRKSLEMVLGQDAAPDAAQMAALLAGGGESDEDDDFHGFGFSGEGAAEEDSGDRALARSLFTQHDADGNGALDAVEVQHFARQMGLKLSAEEAAEAVGEMELATKKDGMVEFDEFWHWFTRKRVGMEPGSVAYRMIQAREQAFQQEMGAQSPMGRMLAAKAGGGKKRQ